MTTCPYCEGSTGPSDIALGPQKILDQHALIHKHCLDLAAATNPELLAVKLTHLPFEQIDADTFRLWLRLIQDARNPIGLT